jgi:hypothetical protein
MAQNTEKSIEQVIDDDFDENPDKWQPINDLSMFIAKDETMDKTNWDAFDYSCSRDEDWYKKRFPGFSDEILQILAHCDGTNKRPDNEKNEWEKRQQLEHELKEKLTVRFD